MPAYIINFLAGKYHLFIYLFIYLFICLFILYLKVDKQIHKTVYIKKIAMYKVTIYTR